MWLCSRKMAWHRTLLHVHLRGSPLSFEASHSKVFCKSCGGFHSKAAWLVVVWTAFLLLMSGLSQLSAQSHSTQSTHNFVLRLDAHRFKGFLPAPRAAPKGPKRQATVVRGGLRGQVGDLRRIGPSSLAFPYPHASGYEYEC